jgi:hypothetical protein
MNGKNPSQAQCCHGCGLAIFSPSECVEESKTLREPTDPGDIFCRICVFLFQLELTGHAAILVEHSRPRTNKRRALSGTHEKTIWIGPTQISLLRALSQAAGFQFKSLAEWFQESDCSVSMETLRKCCHSIVSRGWATGKSVGQQWAMTITEQCVGPATGFDLLQGRHIAEYRIPFKVLHPQAAKRIFGIF